MVRHPRLFSILPQPSATRTPPGYPPKRGPYRAEAGRKNVPPPLRRKSEQLCKTDVPEPPPHNFPSCASGRQTMWKYTSLHKRPNGGEIHSVELFPQKKALRIPHLWKFISPPVEPLKRQMGHVSRCISKNFIQRRKGHKGRRHIPCMCPA